MLLSNQKYLLVKYEFSSEFYTYTKAITSFIYDMVNAYDDATLSNINRFNELEIKHDEDKTVYYQEFDLNNFSSYLEMEITKFFNIYLSRHKEVVFLFENLIIFNEDKTKQKRRESPDNANCEQKKTIEKNVSKVLTGKLNDYRKRIFKNLVKEFWSNQIDEKTYSIFSNYIDQKMDIKDYIFYFEVQNIDFFPIQTDNLVNSQDLIYDNSKVVEINNTVKDKFFEKLTIELQDTDNIVDFIKYKDSEIGIVINDIFYLYDYFNNKDLTTNTPDLLFNYFKHAIKTDFHKNTNEICNFDEFKKQYKNKEMISLLSNLNNNLYLNKRITDIDDNLKVFFNASFLIQNPEFKNFHFFIPSVTNEHLFGVFNNSNERLPNGDSVKGLKSWTDKSSNIIKSFSNKKLDKYAKSEVTHLTPDLAFYYREKFFEDYLESILIDIQKEFDDFTLEFLSNNEFFINDNPNDNDSPLRKESHKNKFNQEFDFVVSITKDGVTKNVVLEAKTKLSKFIADDQREKVQKYMRYDDLNIFDKYVLIGFNTDSTMNSLKYFINKYTIKNISNLDVAFTYPLPETDNDQLFCLASNDYDVLKNGLIQLFSSEIYEK